jgi:ribosomal protein S27E
MDITYSRLPTPPYWPQCSFDGTERIYPSTTTVYRQVNCKGCSKVTVKEHPEVMCPNMRITASISMATPTTKYETVCSPTPTAKEIHDRQVLLSLGVEVGAIAACPTTIFVTAGNDNGPTSTVYKQIISQVQKVNCGGCSLVISTRLGGLGPIYRPSSTVTGAIATTTSYECQ